MESQHVSSWNSFQVVLALCSYQLLRRREVNLSRVYTRVTCFVSALQEWAAANSVPLPARHDQNNSTSYYRFQEPPTNILQASIGQPLILHKLFVRFPNAHHPVDVLTSSILLTKRSFWVPVASKIVVLTTCLLLIAISLSMRTSNGCRVMTRSCGLLKCRGSACSLHRLIKLSVCGIWIHGAVSVCSKTILAPSCRWLVPMASCSLDRTTIRSRC